MDKNEIINYIQMSRDKSICIDRRLNQTYPGFVRDVTIVSDIMVKVEFNVYNYDEGGLTILITYKDIDSLISSLVDYVGIDFEMWMNFSRTGWYPTLNQEVDIQQAGLQLKQDLAANNISLPLGGVKYFIPEGYWKDLADGLIEVF